MNIFSPSTRFGPSGAGVRPPRASALRNLRPAHDLKDSSAFPATFRPGLPVSRVKRFTETACAAVLLLRRCPVQEIAKQSLGRTSPCHPEERSDEGSALRISKVTKADPSLRSEPALSGKTLFERIEQILRFAQDDREESEGMTGTWSEGMTGTWSEGMTGWTLSANLRLGY